MRKNIPSLLGRVSAVVHRVGHFLSLHGPRRFSPRPAVKRLPTPAKVGIDDGDSVAFVASHPFYEPEKSYSEVAADSVLDTKKVESSRNAKLIISVHIPKTGGTSFSEVLRIIAEEVFYLDYGPEIFSPTAVYRCGKLVQEPFEAIADLELLPGRSVVHGHFLVTKYLQRFPDASYITWLRDPVERIASSYFFWQRSAVEHSFMNDPLCNKVINEKMTLEDFAALRMTRNVQYISLAPAEMERFAFVGITEEYERSLELFRRLICPDVKIDPLMLNNNPDRPGNFYDLQPGLREKILKLNELDACTYANGVRRFRRLCEQVGI
jgi:hypothetical protein